MRPEEREHVGLFPDLSVRASVRELMDDGQCDLDRLLRTVDRFRLVNRLLTRYRVGLRRWLLADMLSRPGHTYRIADLGAGGCDVSAWLLDEAERLGLRLAVLAVEADERIAAHVRAKWRHKRGLDVVCQDATDLASLGEVDYIMGNHFLHHLDDGEIERLLGDAAAMPIRRFVFMDLVRSYLAFYTISIFGALTCPRTFIAEDGRRSVRRGFRLSEFESLLTRMGLHERVHVHPLGPGHIVVVGQGARMQQPQGE